MAASGTKTIWLFAGQGCQFPGMGRDFDTDFPLYRRIMEEGSDALHVNLRSLALNGDPDELRQTSVTQPLLLCFGFAVGRVLQEEKGIPMDAAGGHSLGELTAAVMASSLSLADGCRIVQKRGELMQSAVPDGVGAMAAVLNLEVDQLETICASVSHPGHVVVCANYNTPTQTVISGHAAAVASAGEKAKSAGARRVLPLAVSAPFHSPLMEPAATAFAHCLSEYTLSPATTRLYSNTTAAVYSDDVASWASLWCRQIVEPVRFVAQLHAMVGEHEGPLQIFDIAPKATLRPMIQVILGDRPHTAAITVDTVTAIRSVP